MKNAKILAREFNELLGSDLAITVPAQNISKAVCDELYKDYAIGIDYRGAEMYVFIVGTN